MLWPRPEYRFWGAICGVVGGRPNRAARRSALRSRVELANGPGGVWLSIFLVLQIVPYFMTGFESVTKGSEEARAGFDPRNFTKAIYAALVAGVLRWERRAAPG